MTYQVAQAESLARLGVRESAALLVAKWEALVSECEDGYSWDVSEYWNELRVRDVLESLLEERSLQTFDGHAELRSVVAAIDERFRAIVRDDVRIPGNTWWRQAVLRIAGQEYRDYLSAVYGIAVAAGR